MQNIKTNSYYACMDITIKITCFCNNCRYSEGSGTIWLNDVRCTANDVSLADCLHSGFSSVTNCDHSQDVALMCLNSTKS